jgi:hypothetical protein
MYIYTIIYFKDTKIAGFFFMAIFYQRHNIKLYPNNYPCHPGLHRCYFSLSQVDNHLYFYPCTGVSIFYIVQFNVFIALSQCLSMTKCQWTTLCLVVICHILWREILYKILLVQIKGPTKGHIDTSNETSFSLQRLSNCK